MSGREGQGPPSKRPKKTHKNPQQAIDKLKQSVGINDFNTTTNQEALTPAQWIYKNAEEVKR